MGLANVSEGDTLKMERADGEPWPFWGDAVAVELIEWGYDTSQFTVFNAEGEGIAIEATASEIRRTHYAEFDHPGFSRPVEVRFRPE